MVHAEALQALLGRALHGGGREISRRELGGDEDRVARNARIADGAPDLVLVAVHLRRVDVAVAELERFAHALIAAASRELPGAEPDRRHARSLDLDILHPCLSL